MFVTIRGTPMCEDQTSVMDHTPFTPEGGVSDCGVVAGASTLFKSKPDDEVFEDRSFFNIVV